MDSSEFRRLGHALVDWIADTRESVESRPVISPVAPGEIRARFPKEPPDTGGHLGDIVARLDRDVLPGITHWNHPRFFGWFPSNTSYASVLADLACAGLGAQGMSWKTSPAATEVEEVVMDWLRQALGLSGAWHGVIQDTASTATLAALICARERSSDHGAARGGMQSGGAPLVVYASDQAHSSVEKGALLAGFGREHLRLVGTDDAHALRVDLLEEAMAADVAAGRRPCAVVACCGTTGTTAVDPIGRIAAVARRHGAWLHVDAALAGTAMVLPECRPLWDGVEEADSVVVNPHKWMGAGFDLTATWWKDAQHLVRVMSTNPAYLRTAHDGAVTNFRDWHIPLGRRFRSLKLWFLLEDEGVEGIRARVRRDLANARWLAAQVDAAPGWERLAPVPLQTVVVRHVPGALRGDEAALDRHNSGIADRIEASGFAALTTSVLKGMRTIRVSIGAMATERPHVAALWERMQREATE